MAKDETGDEPTREERLAERLRANLKRRKAQGRAMASEERTAPDEPAQPLSNEGDPR